MELIFFNVKSFELLLKVFNNFDNSNHKHRTSKLFEPKAANTRDNFPNPLTTIHNYTCKLEPVICYVISRCTQY